MFTINAMASFEDDIKRVAFLVVFIPLCLSVGGNAGSQAATLVIRALALDQIRARDWLRVFRRELLMAAALAATLGVLSVARTYFLTPDNILSDVPPGKFWELIWVVTLAVMGICLTGALIGAMLPLVIKWSAATRRSCPPAHRDALRRARHRHLLQHRQTVLLLTR